jgi:hypothetical protein
MKALECVWAIRYGREVARIAGLGWSVLSASLFAACAASMMAQTSEEQSRRDFLRTVDAAIESRSASRLSTLADLDRWLGSGRSPLDQLTLWLPPKPIERKRDLSANEFLYEDGEGKSWRLRIAHQADSRDWRVILPDAPCPPKGMPRMRPSDPAGAPAPVTAPSRTWTILECWPLPY